MKSLKSRILFSGILTTSLLSSCSNGHFTPREKTALEELDRIVASAPDFKNNTLAQIRVIADDYNKANADEDKMTFCASLIERYRKVSTDSMAKYSSWYSEHARSEREIAVSGLYECYVAYAKQDYAICEKTFKDIDTTALSKDKYLAYIDLAAHLFYSQYIRTTYPGANGYFQNRSVEFYRERLTYYRQLYNRHDSTSSTAMILRYAELREEGRFKDGLDFLLANIDLPKTNEDKAQLYRDVSDMYERLGDMEDALVYKSLDAACRIEEWNNDNLAIMELASMMLERGDLKRAVRYIELGSQASFGLVNVARMTNVNRRSTAILDAVSEKNHRFNTVIYISMSLLAVFAAVLVYLCMRSVRLSRSLNASLARLSETHGKLLEADSIKARFLFQYMVKSATLMDSADSVWKDLRKMQKSNPEMLKHRLSEPSPFERDFKSFYNNYDRDFLSLFPGFVDAVNKIMPQNGKFHVNPDGTMPPELRVLSAVRLGMKDSGSIARFLGYSITTVYSYRYRAAERSRLDRNLFEEYIGSCSI